MNRFVSAALVTTAVVPRFRLSYILDVLQGFVILNVFDEDEVVLVHAMEAYRGSKGIAPLLALAHF
jgi:hypothetical protein